MLVRNLLPHRRRSRRGRPKIVC